MRGHMKDFKLPFLQAGTPLTNAIESLRTFDSRAFVTKIGNTHRLITNRNLRDGWLQSANALADVPSLDISPESQTDIQILSVTNDEILLRSSHETIANLYLFATKVCICTINQNHTCDSPPAQDGQQCDYCSGRYKCF